MMNSEKTGYVAPEEQEELHCVIADLCRQVREKHKLLDEALALNAELQKWKAAVEDALVIDGIFNASHADPRKAVLDLQLWERQVALDPAVSAGAVELQEAVAEACAKYLEDDGLGEVAKSIRAGKWRGE